MSCNKAAIRGAQQGAFGELLGWLLRKTTIVGGRELENLIFQRQSMRLATLCLARILSRRFHSP